jgi:Tfp pilus assembly protein PilN
VLSLAGVAAGVLALALGGLVLQQRGVVDDHRSQLRDVQARLVAAEAKAAAIREAQAANQARLTAVRDLVSRRIVWEDVLRDLSRVLPANVYLQSLQVGAASSAAPAAPAAPADPAAPAAPAPGAAFTISGFADSQVRVAQVLDRLALLPWLTGVTLQSSTSAGGSERTPVAFTLGASFTAIGGGR